MKRALEQKQASREAPALAAKIRDTVVGVGLIVGGFFCILSDAIENEWIFLILVLLGAFMVSKSLVVDFLKVVGDKIRLK